MAATLSVTVEDFTSSARREASNVPADATVGDFVEAVSRLMLLPQQEDGRPITYGAQTVDGEVLNGSERVGDVLDDRAVVQLTRNVTAG
jgi:hypothetical protein